VDGDVGSAFVKICACFPCRGKIWYEWAKRQVAAAGVGFRELSNGFARQRQPPGLVSHLRPVRARHCHCVCRTLAGAPAAAVHVGRPVGGYWWDISMRQIEIA